MFQIVTATDFSTSSLTCGSIRAQIEKDAEYYLTDHFFGQKSLNQEEEHSIGNFLLSLEEVFFLVSEKSNLFVLLSNKQQLSPEDLWSLLITKPGNFSRRYCVYHHFRQKKKWIVRPGQNYGAQYVLYRNSPDISHSEYIVFLQSGDEHMKWQNIQTVSRIAMDVHKKAIFCSLVNLDSSSDAQFIQYEVLEMMIQACDFTANTANKEHPKNNKKRRVEESLG